MATPAFVQIGYTMAVVLLAICLLISGINLGVVVYRERYHLRIFNYLMVGLLSLGAWSVIWLIRSAPIDLRLLSLLTGVQGAVLSLWYVRLALHLKSLPEKATLLSIVAATTSFLAMVLSTQFQPSRLSAVAVIAYFSMFIGMQILLTAMYLYRELKMEVETLSYTHFRKPVPHTAIDSLLLQCSPLLPSRVSRRGR
jgi:hypothetical protein